MALTERQLQRRNKILTSARRMLEERGYDGLKMRELAESAGVSPATLYDIYGSKDDLIARTVEQQSRVMFETLDKDIEATGIERLFAFAERECQDFLSSPALGRAVAPLFAAKPGTFLTEEIYMKHHRRAIRQIRKAGELAPWADIDFLVHLLLLQNHGIVVFWAHGEVSTESFENFIMLNICNVMAPVTSGETREIISVKHKRISKEMKDWDF